MAASFADPKVTNLILNDVGAIQQLLGYLCQAQPSLGTNYPNGSIRIIATGANNTMFQIQRYNGSAWDTVGQLQHDVTSLKGYVPSTSAVKNTIPVYNASGQLVGNVTGNAATATKLATPRSIQVGGIASSTAQNFDGTANVTIPINQITINNSNDTAVNGTLTIKHGGTGRTDGAAQDVVVASAAGNVLAKAYGQIGNAINKGAVNLDTLVVPGNYLVNTTSSGWESRHCPQYLSEKTPIRVVSDGSIIYQNIEYIDAQWSRRSTDGGASWSYWYPSFINANEIIIYISKSGSDTNTGLSNGYPVLTVNRALQIATAKNQNNSNSQGRIILRFGAGSWGTLTFRSPLVSNIEIYPFDGATPTAYSTSLPVFDVIHAYNTFLVICGCVVNKYINAVYGAFVYVSAGYKRIGAISAYYHSFFMFASQNAATNLWEIPAGTITDNVLYIGEHSGFYSGYLHIKLAANMTKTQFFGLSRTATADFYGGRTVIDSSSYTFTGKKYALYGGAAIAGFSKAQLDAFPGTAAGTIENGVLFNGNPWGYGLDANMVHKSGNETITGVKTIDANTTYGLILKDRRIEYNKAPSSSTWNLIQFTDKNNAEVGYAGIFHEINGNVSFRLYVKGQDGVFAGLEVKRDSNKISRLYFGTPPAADNTTSGATTAWVRSTIATLAPAEAVMKGATTSAAGVKGLAPAPAAGAANRYLRSDGTWQVPPDNNTTYGVATQTANGLLSAADKKKLDGIEAGATNAINSRKVALKGSRSTDGDWSITGLTVGVPLIIVPHPKSNNWMIARIKSGSVQASGTASNPAYGIGPISNNNIPCVQTLTVIPNATTVVITCVSNTANCPLYAYQ